MSAMMTLGAGALLVLALAIFLPSASDRRERLVQAGGILLAGAVGLSAYAMLGAPGMADQPFRDRARELAQRDISELSQAERIVALQETARTEPDNPVPQTELALILYRMDRAREAEMAYRAALRRDPDHVPALIEYGVLAVEESEGRLTPLASELFDRALSRPDPDFVRVALAGNYLNGHGHGDAAEAVWAKIRTKLPDASLERYDAMIDGFRAERVE